MKKILCNLIASAPAPHISADPQSVYYRAAMLDHEADTTEYLLMVLMRQYNSAVEPQARLYERISRIHDKASARSRRRSIAQSIEIYRTIRRRADQVPTDHVFYHEIVDALLGDEEAAEVQA